MESRSVDVKSRRDQLQRSQRIVTTALWFDVESREISSEVLR
jgi:hypothetical protein